MYGSTFNFQKFAADGTVQPLFEVLEKLQEYLFAIMEDKIKKGEIACLGHRTAHMPKEGAVLVKSLFNGGEDLVCLGSLIGRQLYPTFAGLEASFIIVFEVIAFFGPFLG